MALEDWALKNLDTSQYSYLILYVNKPSVVVGRNQNIFEEVDLKYCKRNNIDIARRISGGGTVFHDLGNLNWAFITDFCTKKVNNYDWAASKIMNLLADYSLVPYLTERNAIEVDGVKLSGQAQFTNRKNILSHGTLLVNSDLSLLQKAIEIENPDAIQSKASKSVRSKTGNLETLLHRKITPFQVIDDLKDFYNLEIIDFSLIDFNSNLLNNEEWIYTRSPKFTVTHTVNNEDYKFTIIKGIIETVENKKGHQLNDSPLLNVFYKDYLFK